MTPPDPFDPLLRRWENVPEPKPSLKGEVWRRIAMVEATSRKPSFASRMESWFSVPAFSTAFVACCILIGLFVAELRVSNARHDRQLEVARQYVRLIDPLGANEPSPRIP